MSGGRAAGVGHHRRIVRSVPYRRGKAVVIPLQDGTSAIVDSCHWMLACAGSWSRSRGGYATRRASGGLEFLHWRVYNDTPRPPSRRVLMDHINGNRLDCRRKNLRLCEFSQNNYNKAKRCDSRQQFKGVESRGNHHRVHFRSKGFRSDVGGFATAADAAREYDRLALLYHGAFAKTNVMLGLLPPLRVI